MNINTGCPIHGNSLHLIMHKGSSSYSTYCRPCAINHRKVKYKRPKETLKSLSAKVKRYIQQHNLHNSKNKLRYFFNELNISIRKDKGVFICRVSNKKDLQNTFNILKHRVREALKPEVDLRPQDEKWGSYEAGEARRVGHNAKRKLFDMIEPRQKVKETSKYNPTGAQKAHLREQLKSFRPMQEPRQKVIYFENESLLPKDSAERKTYPIFTGALRYFPRAIAAVSNQSYKGNQKHHLDKPLHWDKSKSADHEDCLVRHLVDSLDPTCDKTGELTAVAWRALALLETHLEKPSE